MIKEIVKLENERVLLEVEIGKRICPFKLYDKKEAVYYADNDYAYKIKFENDGRIGTIDASILYESHRLQETDEGNVQLYLHGRLELDGKPTTLKLNQIFTLQKNNDASLNESVSLENEDGRNYHIIEIHFGFRKKIYNRVKENWAENFESFKLYPVPHRRRFGHRVDRKVDHYTLQDLLHHMWEGELTDLAEDRKPEYKVCGWNLPDHGAEGWVWSDGSRGLLIQKFSEKTIEFSLFKGELTPPDCSVRFGGVGVWREDPEVVREINKKGQVTFGITHYEFIVGDWQDGYYAFRSFLHTKNKFFPKDYNPPVHWNELYNLSWAIGDGSQRYTLEQIYREAEIASDMGCESLYLDPGWDRVEGSTVWDEDYFGISLKDFVKTIQDRYGLKVSLHLMTHCNSTEEYKGMYQRSKDGKIVPIWNGAKICTQSGWKAEKTRRLLELAEAGISFFMFDFQEYAPGCCDKNHGHEIPLKRQSHADGIYEVISNIKREYPELYIEAHDRITTGLQDYHPLYFQYDPPHSFDENWGFEYMWDSYLDLISGKALSLYEYNLAYEVPLYLHINIGKKSGLLNVEGNSVGPDNLSMLSFWWYASTIRHLGFGGVSNPESKLYKALKGAMGLYMNLEAVYKRGTFYGLDYEVHLHKSDEVPYSIINCYNLSGTKVTKTISFNRKKYGITASKLEIYNGIGEKVESRSVDKNEDWISFEVEVGKLAPSIILLHP